MKEKIKKVWLKYRDLDLFHKIVVALTFFTVLGLIIIEMKNIITIPKYSIVDFIKGGFLLPIVIIGLICAIMVWNRISSRFLSYRYDIHAPKWLKILAWILFFTWIISKLRFFN